MPIYEFQLIEGDCAACGGSFELLRPHSRRECDECPLCRRPVRRAISRIHTPAILKPVSVVDAKKAGFTVLERRDRGTYERL